MDDKRFDDLVLTVTKHEDRINGLDREQGENHVLLKSVKGDTVEIKTALGKLPCNEHRDDLTTIKTTTRLRRRLVEIGLGSSGVVGVILIGLKLVGVI